jgi:redox-sensitive bicupin YhaK (pirin superfamily)
MSAGTGILHSEFNLAKAPVHFYQVWLTPNQRHVQPSYAQTTIDPSAWNNRPGLLASGHCPAEVVINSDTSIYRARLDEHARLSHKAGRHRGTFIYVSAGALQVAGHSLHAGDQLRSDDEGEIAIIATSPSEFILIDVAL